MCNDQEQRPLYFGWCQTCIIHTRLKDALQADEQVNKDRLVALGIEDRHPMRKRSFIEWTKIRRGSVAPMRPPKTNLGCCAAIPGFPLTNTPSFAQRSATQTKSTPFTTSANTSIGFYCSIDTGKYSQYLASFAACLDAGYRGTV